MQAPRRRHAVRTQEHAQSTHKAHPQRHRRTVHGPRQTPRRGQRQEGGRATTRLAAVTRHRP
eukprot:1694603-Alexandrium_andersonii.AAC.1